MLVFPVVVVAFFTTMMKDGQPVDMPVGVVDLDNTSTSRSLIRKLDAFETSRVVATYPNINEARKAIQHNDIYAFIYIPKGTTEALISSRQPKISFYYSSTSLTVGALLFRDMKTISMLGSAGVGLSTLTAKGATASQAATFLQPILIDLHPLNNPEISYNVYLSTWIIPGCLLIFVFLLTAYSIGTELKFNHAKVLMRLAGNRISIALIGKMIPQTIINLTIFYAYMFYIFGWLSFPHPGGIGVILLTGLLTVLASEAFGVFAFGLTPSLRMSMSVSALWSVLSFSLAGSAYPLFAMDAPIQTIAQLFPLRHYYQIYQICIFNGYPLSEAWWNIGALIIFIALPLLVLRRIRVSMQDWVYIP